MIFVEAISWSIKKKKKKKWLYQLELTHSNYLLDCNVNQIKKK